MTRTGVDRILRYAFELARTPAAAAPDLGDEEQRHLDLDALLGRAGAERWPAEYPDVDVDKYHIDILTANFVLHPDWFDVVVASNLFGDILSDLGPACTGTIGIAPSANINPERNFPSLFEPVHGSAPDIAGKGIANPIGQIWCASMMLEHLGGARRRRVGDAGDRGRAGSGREPAHPGSGRQQHDRATRRCRGRGGPRRLTASGVARAQEGDQPSAGPRVVAMSVRICT